MENKQTAVEAIYELLDENRISDIAELKPWFLNMEKEQIIDSFRNGLDDFYDKDTFFYENGEKYYNENYKQQDK
jgi:hypothetical protein